MVSSVEQRVVSGVAGGSGRGEELQQLRFHAQVGGTMILEYPVVPDEAGGTREVRRIDNIILPAVPCLTVDGVQKNIVHAKELPYVQEDYFLHLRVGPVISVQAKDRRLGPCLLGQALFSRGLLMAQGAKVRRSVALCGDDEPELSAIARDRFGLEVIVDPLAQKSAEPRSLLRRNPEAVRAYWSAVGGSFYPEYPIINAGTRRAVRVDAVIVEGQRLEHPTGTASDLSGCVATIVVSTKMRVGMYSLGIAVFARAIAERAGAHAKAVLVARDHDSALRPLLDEHPQVNVIPERELLRST